MEDESDEVKPGADCGLVRFALFFKLNLCMVVYAKDIVRVAADFTLMAATDPSFESFEATVLFRGNPCRSCRRIEGGHGP